MSINTIIDGLSLGAVYALIALGYTMVYGIAKMLNFAHGDIIMVGAYSVYVTLLMGGSPIFIILALVIPVIVCTLLGVAVERFAYRPLRGASPLAVLITAIGVSYLLQGMAQLIFGAKSRPVAFKIEGTFLGISLSTIVTLLVGAAIMVALTLFVNYTRTGRAMVAVSEDRSAAQLMGVNVNKIIALTFAIGSGLAAFAGIFYVMKIPSTDPMLGSMPGIKAFTAAVIGGIGSIPGAMIGGFAIGMAEALVSAVGLSTWRDGVVFAILIVVLLVKPTGIMGRQVTEKV